ncbi:MAG: sugar transferase [Aquabacterium sp.]|uniref:sugar transferase n=1 Tax=Aquabacterium sp. TaxID=1872578 RepID=UPI00271F2296|nr:sugar transferase [Aquabacterium sp.]MDO9004219.1 sugar transferase [Aquabacterium sp.]
MSKRLFDLLLASLGLLLLSPALLLVALAIKLDSPGPVFFRQERVGRFGQPFRIHKFRTMRHDPQGTGPQITVGADHRITRIGHALRGSKLDELPQLIDVWLGRMSLVGPRPEVPRYVSHYPASVRDKVLSVRPGITDLASIEYRDESSVLARASDPEHAYIHEILPHKLALAVRYVDQASVWTDIRLIARTLAAIARG